MLPPDAVFAYKRVSTPPAQRTPWPNTVPVLTSASPWSTMLVALGSSPAVLNTTVSAESSAWPPEPSTAPPEPAELLQPLVEPGGSCALLHGHAITPARPGTHMSAPGEQYVYVMLIVMASEFVSIAARLPHPE